jgi:ATP-dependent Clp protease protease subunit
MSFSPDSLPLLDDSENDDEEKGSGANFFVKSLIKSRTLVIAKQVDRKLMEKVTTALMALENLDSEALITIVVNSPGGDADSGFAIHDILHFSRPPIRAICAGLAASAAVPIFLGADKGQRFILPNSRFLLHQPSMQMMGQATDLEITATEITRIRVRYNQIVAEETGREAAQVEKDCDRDFWLNAEETVDYGLADKVISSRAEIE